MKGKWVAGMYLLLNERAMLRWLKKTFGWTDERKPLWYPCLAIGLLGSDENLYPSYTYLSDVENMHNALLEAVESTKTDSQQALTGSKTRPKGK